MTVTPDTPWVKKYVLVFDFCSSTSILENLTRSEPQHWQKLLLKIRKFLAVEQKAMHFEVYKFVGDGWILVFDSDFSIIDLLSFMKRLSDEYENLFTKNIRPVLSNDIRPLGISFGIEKGSVTHFKMEKGRYEYIGIPINVASRLQAQIRTEDDNPEGKVLTSKHVINKEKTRIRKKYRMRPVIVDLRNILGGERYEGVLLSLTDKPHKDSVRYFKDKAFPLDGSLGAKPSPLATECLTPQEPLLDCTLEVEFRIDGDSGYAMNWFGVRFRGRGEADHLFDGYLVYVRSKGSLDVRSLGRPGLEIEKSVTPPSKEVKMKITIIRDRCSVLMDGCEHSFPANEVMRSGKVYLHALGTKVTIASVRLTEVIT